MAQSYAKDQPAGFKNRIEKIAIVGAGGQIGTHITRALLSTNRHAVTALTRPGSTSTLPSGLSVVQVDYDDASALTKALAGHDFLIITLSLSAPPDTQAKLIAAAAAARIRFVMPNWYGFDYANAELLHAIPVAPEVRGLTAEVERHGMSSWVMLACGLWYEYSLTLGDDSYGIDVKGRKVTWLDEGERVINHSSWPQVGKAVAGLVGLKVLPEDEEDEEVTLSSLGNRVVYVSSFRASQKMMFESVKKVTGTTDEDWTMAHESTAQRYEDGGKRLERGDISGFLRQLYSRLLSPRGEGDFESKHGLHNEVLGLEQEDLDYYTKVAVGAVNNGKFEY
ncbi:putative oxidoreductase CipA, partial [Corynespora cassiicola Philippines]